MQTASVGKTFLRYTFFSVLGMVGILFAVVMASWDIKSLWDEFSKFLGILLGVLLLFLLRSCVRTAQEQPVATDPPPVAAG